MPKTVTLARIGAGAAALTLVAPAAAFAHGRPAVVKARPARAPRVCMALQATTLHGPLASLTADQLTALRTDCSTLQSAQQAAAPAIAAAQQAERSAVSSALAALKSACASSTSTTPAQPSADCLAAWSTFKSTVQSARTTYEQAVQTAVAPVVAAEKQLVSDLSADGIGVQAGHLARGHHHRGR